VRRRRIVLTLVALLLTVVALSALVNRGPARSWVMGSTQSHFDQRAATVAAAWQADADNQRPPGAPPVGGSSGRPESTGLGARTLVPVAWRAAPPNDSTVLVDAGTGSCDTALEPLVWESAEVVVVGAAVRVPMSGGCDDMLNWHELTITLDEPLAGRALLDAYTGGPVAPGWSFP
jgi:hypothetical protein